MLTRTRLSRVIAGIVGLGIFAGLGSCAQTGSQSEFIESEQPPVYPQLSTNPDVPVIENIAYSQRGEFTYLARCAARAPVVIGDARLKLAEAKPASFDLLVVDAFSSDAIPLHLLTDEAHAVYFRALAPDCLLLVHVSNRFVELEPVLAALARERGLAAAIRRDKPTGPGVDPSNWVALSRDPRTLATLTGDGAWHPLAPPAGQVWRDDFASILPHVTWHTIF